MELRINLATRSYVNIRQLKLWLAVALCVLVLCLIGNIRWIVGNAAQKSKLTKDMDVLEGKFRASARGVSEAEYRALLDRIKTANTVIERKSLDWLLLLDKLEGLVPDGVAMSSVEPYPKDRSLKLTGVATSFKNVRKLIESLEDSKDFEETFLVSHGETAFGKTQKGVSFTITCKVAF